jgi:muramoyltetrapeptide carboxypeptidase LdcA involved in peptidoglycan recycling
MIKIPPYLKPGDTIGIVCPAGYMALEKAQTCIDTLGHWGYKRKSAEPWEAVLPITFREPMRSVCRTCRK